MQDSIPGDSSLTQSHAAVVAWHKAEGDRVTQGEVIAEVETEKVDNELTSPCDGVLARILVAEEETVDVGTVLAIIAADEAEAAALRAD